MSSPRDRAVRACSSATSSRLHRVRLVRAPAKSELAISKTVGPIGVSRCHLRHVSDRPLGSVRVRPQQFHRAISIVVLILGAVGVTWLSNSADRCPVDEEPPEAARRLDEEEENIP